MSIAQWKKFKAGLFYSREHQFSIDLSRIDIDSDTMSSYLPRFAESLSKMQQLEAGAIANPDEKRMVGHYWLRDSQRAPETQIRTAIEAALQQVKEFAALVHSGELQPERGGVFESLLIVGIGGSALGPQFVTQALGNCADRLEIFFLDNTDPDGMQKVLSAIPTLEKTLTVVISKSGGTKETRNGQLIAKAAYSALGLNFAKHFVAVTGSESELDRTAIEEEWIARFPMWDWVGGRTSEFSAVGLLPAALQGYDIEAILRGARVMDELTRSDVLAQNPAGLLAVAWHHVGRGIGSKDMVVLPYKDRLELFSRYLQQLVMESLGKKHDLDGKVVHQGIAVYGNKGSTDQHAYVQQLRDGVNNFFAVFLEVLAESSPKSVHGKLPASFSAAAIEVEPGVYAGDYLSGFFLGTRAALHESQRQSVTITIAQVREFEVGMLIALFERAVGLYATMINVNAYHQPGVEAGKKAAAEVLALQLQVVSHLKKKGESLSLEEISSQIDRKDEQETIFKILQHLAANQRVAVTTHASVFEDLYRAV